MELPKGAVLPAGAPDVRGEGVVEGRITGPVAHARIEGTLKASSLAFSSVSANGLAGTYRVDLPDWQLASAAGSMDARADLVSIGGQSIEAVHGVVDYSATEAKVQLGARKGRSEVSLKGSTIVHADHNEVHVEEATLTIGGTRWRLQPTASGAIQWSSGSVRIPAPLQLSTPDGSERIDVSGTLTWSGPDSRFEVSVPALQLATIDSLAGGTGRYAGLLSGTVNMTGNVRAPALRGSIEVVNGQIQAFQFERLTANGVYADDAVKGRMRIDQGPGVWLEASGTVPRTFGRPGDTREVDLSLKSSPIDLAIVAPLTSRIAAPRGVLTVDLGVRGTAEDPRFSGTLAISGASFLVPLTGTRYSAGEVELAFEPDVISVNRFHLEDDKNDPIDISGRIATHELRVRDVALDVSATKFELLSNQYGDIDVDALVQIQGDVGAPTVSGDIVLSHASINLNPIVTETLRRPYSVSGVSDVIGVEPSSGPLVIGPLWQRLALALRVSIPDDLSLRGDQLSPTGGTVGVGDVRIIAGGELSIRKVANGPLRLVGPLRIVRGTYSFQGKRFDIVPDGEIRFTGEAPIDPVLALAATRTILGVETRVDIHGTWRAPELALSSTPPLDEADILSLIVFNQSSNELLSEQRYELGIRAAALASGFVTTPILNSVSRAIGFDTLGIDPLADPTGAARLTASRQFGTRLFVTYVRQLGNRGFNEMLIEYELSRALRMKGSVSDAALNTHQSLFERVERFGIDFLFFFSY
jgi:translocation and assembly module TamB